MGLLFMLRLLDFRDAKNVVLDRINSLLEMLKENMIQQGCNNPQLLLREIIVFQSSLIHLIVPWLSENHKDNDFNEEMKTRKHRFSLLSHIQDISKSCTELQSINFKLRHAAYQGGR